MSRLIFGFDPSLTHFGYAVALAHGPDIHWSAMGVWVTQPWKGTPTKTEDTRRRVEGLGEMLWGLVRRHGVPDVVAVEALALPLGKTSLVTVSALGRVRGLVDALTSAHGLKAVEFQPMALKAAVTGERTAEKAAVELALVRRYPDIESLLTQISRANREHAADAAAAVHAALALTTQHPPQEQ